ncbi:hypothetical protein Taro_003340 [Colocasia esculenta]|uniref:Uncharacterized protein n=1 Tax=Colocasia esculenta TaxID=4460 RepID=A0A843TNS9_COLES|nr:hypothetical protein [Colocasia esculenta]
MSVLELVAELADSRAEGKMRFGRRCQRGPDSPLSHCLSLRWFRSHVVVLGVGLQLGQAAVVSAFLWCSVAALSCSSGEFRSPVLGCQSMVAPVRVTSRPRSVSEVRGGSAYGPSTLWRSEVAVLVVRHPSHVVARWSP